MRNDDELQRRSMANTSEEAGTLADQHRQQEAEHKDTTKISSWEIGMTREMEITTPAGGVKCHISRREEEKTILVSGGQDEYKERVCGGGLS
jgi:hypothetical protein